MSEQDWTAKEVQPPPSKADREHTATIDGLEVAVKERHPAGIGLVASWTVMGFLADISVGCYSATHPGGYDQTVEQAKAEAARAAHRLYAAGVRGEVSYPVPCCDRLFVTRDAADEHEGEHVEEAAGAFPTDDELHAEAAIVAAPLHFGLDSLTPACEAPPTEGWRLVFNPELVTCPACLEWIARNVPPSAEEPRYIVEEGGGTHYVTDTRSPDFTPGEKVIVLSTTSEENALHAADQLNAGVSLGDLEDVAGPEEVDSEHEAFTWAGFLPGFMGVERDHEILQNEERRRAEQASEEEGA